MAALPTYLRPLTLVAMHTGLRQGELLNLRWNDVDLSASVLVVKEAKSGEGRRIPFNSAVREAFLGIKGGGNHRRKRVIQSAGDRSGYVFRAKEGGVLQNLRRTWGGGAAQSQNS